MTRTRNRRAGRPRGPGDYRTATAVPDAPPPSPPPFDDELVCALLDESAESLYENAPCGYVTTLPTGRIVKVNGTLSHWLGVSRDELVGHRYFSDLLTVGGKIYHETHYAPILLMKGEIGGIALDLACKDGTRFPVLATSTVKTGDAGQPVLIRTTLFDARERRSYEAELLRARREAELERERLQTLTSTLRSTLLPPTLPEVDGLDVDAYYHVASPDEVGGDFYDLFPVRAGSWGLFLGDVCGKGARAAIVTSIIRYTLRAAAVYDPDPAAVLQSLNRTLLDERNGDARAPFCTLVFGTVTPDESTGGVTMSLATGGHPPGLLVCADGRTDYLPTVGGQLIGLLPAPDLVTRAVHLAPGDTLLFYTDGVTEALVSEDEPERYGEQRLLEHVRALGPVSATTLVAELRELLGTLGAGVQDDVALMAVHARRREDS